MSLIYLGRYLSTYVTILSKYHYEAQVSLAFEIVDPFYEIFDVTTYYVSLESSFMSFFVSKKIKKG